jgi:DNA polymerase/3'-5' exonuclease PolX
MSTATKRITWHQANRLAYKPTAELRPSCERIEVAGSVRRRAATIGDLDLLVIPKREPGLFGATQPGESLLDPHLQRLVDEGRLRPGRCNGEKSKHFLTQTGVGVELWIAVPDQWGVLMAVRTGPADFTRSLVTERKNGGRLLDSFAVHEWKVWQRLVDPHYPCIEVIKGEQYEGLPLCFDDERNFLESMCGGWIEPEDRR